MPVYEIDPLSDPRWNDLVGRHPLASVFHSVAWLRALRRTYGYQSVALTTSRPSGVLENGLVACRVSSWLTGRRYVSLPFSDHCDLLTSAPDDEKCLLTGLANDLAKEHGTYAEIRPLNSLAADKAGFQNTQEFCFHKLDLNPSSEELFRKFHKDSIQRKIHRSEREQLSFEEGRTEQVLESFYRLLLITRRRHRLPPPPRKWFRNLIDCVGDQLTIRIAAKDGNPVAAILTLKFRDTLVYKYSGSDTRFHALGGTHALIWRAIQDAKRQGLQHFDFGRSDLDNQGLITFKDRWGTVRLRVTYFRYAMQPSRVAGSSWSTHTVRQLFAHMPISVLRAAGRLLYKHVG
jgi:CelD/BcsL family acetyltransferase involved in cellulose biosynthesis